MPRTTRQASVSSQTETEPPLTPCDSQVFSPTNPDSRALNHHHDHDVVRKTDPSHPFANAKSLLIVIPEDRIDVEAEVRFYEQFQQDANDGRHATRRSFSAPASPRTRHPQTPSIFSNDIWLGDNSGGSVAFARSLSVTGWTHVGDKLGGAYVVYDCAIRTSQNTTIHAHKRYSSFLSLYTHLLSTLPPHLRTQIPLIPPKAPFAKFRPGFLEKRRRLLEHWLSAVLLHPEIGGVREVREWVLD